MNLVTQTSPSLRWAVVLVLASGLAACGKDTAPVPTGATPASTAAPNAAAQAAAAQAAAAMAALSADELKKRGSDALRQQRHGVLHRAAQKERKTQRLSRKRPDRPPALRGDRRRTGHRPRGFRRSRAPASADRFRRFPGTGAGPHRRRDQQGPTGGDVARPAG